MYVNEENEPNISEYTPTPFNLPQERGRGYWKLNSSVLNDNAYIAMVRQTSANVDKLSIRDPQKWWDTILTSVRFKTVEYTKKKHSIENACRSLLREDLLRLEAVPTHQLTPSQAARCAVLKEKLKTFEEKLIEGYRHRTRGLPRYEQREPGIEFYAKLEKRSTQRTVIGELRHKDGTVYSDNQHLLDITTEFYTELYTPNSGDESVQEKLLCNVDHKLTDQQKCMLDAELTQKEIKQAVYELNDAKSPGIDGFTGEFYKKFWPLLQDCYAAFINCANRTSFSHSKNTSVTSIMYKEKEDTDDLNNYRPISLINVDLNILTKALTNRLRMVLPSVIHYTQTAADGRKIDNTVHMLRDLIQVENIEDIPSAFIFLD